MRRLATIAVLVAAGLFLTTLVMRSHPIADAQAPKVQQWEYKAIPYDGGIEGLETELHAKEAPKVTAFFNRQGADGWEFAGTAGHFVVFKRPKK